MNRKPAIRDLLGYLLGLLVGIGPAMVIVPGIPPFVRWAFLLTVTPLIFVVLARLCGGHRADRS